MIGLWWVFVVILTATYTGNLVSNLAILEPENFPIKTMMDLATSKVVKPGIPKGTVLDDVFLKVHQTR